MNPDAAYILPSGESISAREIYEAIAIMARDETSFPLLSRGDMAHAFVMVAFYALDWAERNES